jgi:IPT/TIG domain
VGGADVTMSVIGSGFTAESKIYFNGGEEPTTLVSPTEVTTVVKPSTASGPWTLPVWVQNGSEQSNTLNFSFSEPPPV